MDRKEKYFKNKYKFVFAGFFSLLALTASLLVFGTEKITQNNFMKPDTYVVLNATLLLVGGIFEFLTWVVSIDVDERVLQDLHVKAFPKNGFADCFFRNCEFTADMTGVKFESCFFEKCKFNPISNVEQLKTCIFNRCKFNQTTATVEFFRANEFLSCDVITIIRTDLPAPKPNWIGNKSCYHNAKSPNLRCAINPSGPCEGCLDFMPEPVFDDVRSLFLDLPRQLRMGEIETIALNPSNPIYDKYAIAFANKSIQMDQPITDELFEVCLVFEELLEDVFTVAEHRALATVEAVIVKYERENY